MSLSPMEALCLDLKRIWINKAQYEDAERKFQIAVQKHREDEILTTVPRKRKRSKKNKLAKIEDNQIDKLVEVALQYEAKNWHLNPTQFADVVCVIMSYKEKQLEDQVSNAKKKPKSMKSKPANKVKTSKHRNSDASIFKTDSSQKQKLDGLTPYQGGKRCFGEFKCKSCRWEWSSAFSWANMSQQCRICNRNAYPYRQHKLENVYHGSDDERCRRVKQHDTTKCEKCRRTEEGDCRYLSY